MLATQTVSPFSLPSPDSQPSTEPKSLNSLKSALAEFESQPKTQGVSKSKDNHLFGSTGQFLNAQD